MPELREDELNSVPSSVASAQSSIALNSVTDEDSSNASNENFQRNCVLFNGSSDDLTREHHETEADLPMFNDDKLESIVLVKEDNENKPRYTQSIVNIWKLFRFATALDWFLMVIGCLMAVLHGLVLPIALAVLSFITDTFLLHELSHVIANSQYNVPFQYLLSLQSGGNERVKLEVGDLTYSVIEEDQNEANIEFNVQNLTRGVVNCSAVYTYKLPHPILGQVNFTIGELVRSATGPTSVCYDDKSFVDHISTLIVGLLAVIIIVAIVGALQMLLFHLTSERQIRKMKLLYFRSILRQERKWHDQQTQGELALHLSEDIEKVHDGVGTNLGILVQYVSTFAAGVLCALYLNWSMTLLLLVITPFIVVPSGVFNQLVATFGSAEQKHYATAGNVAEEVLSAIRTVVAFSGEYKEANRYLKHLNAAKKIGTRRGIVGGLSLFIVHFFLFSSFGLAFWYGAYIVSENKATGGVIAAVFFCVWIGSFYLGQSIINIGKLMTATVTAVSIFETIDKESKIDPLSEKGEDLEKFDGKVDFKAVTFSYPSRPNFPVIKEFDLSIKPGQVVTIVGPSGGGKSTFVKLLQRFYDPDVGKVMFDGKDIRSLNVKWLRSQIGTVSQEPILFNTSIRENILYGNKDATMPDVVQAARAANAHHFIMSLPCGYSTVVGEQGGQLSGGQKQRIAIARALVRNPKILLFDEATSALDTENEAILLEMIKNVAGEKTVIVITHRLPLVKCADVVLSVEGGQVAWKGTPTEFYKIKDINMDKDDDPTLSFPARKLAPQMFRKGQTLSLRRQNASLRREHLIDKEKEVHGEISIFMKILALNKREWWIVLLGLLAAVVSGTAFPIFSLLFGGIVNVFTQESRDVFPLIHPWASGFIVLALGIGVAIFIKTLCFSVAGEKLTRRIRHLMFKAMLRQEIGWFDSDDNTTGVLVGTLSEDGRNVQSIAGTLSVFAEGATAIVLAHVVSLRYNWILTIILSAVVPLYLLSVWAHSRASFGFARIRRQALQDAAETAVESVENIETVSSLGLEERMCNDYEQKIKRPTRRALALAPLSGLSQTVLLLGYIIAFRFGAYQVTLEKDNILYSRFVDVLIVFASLTLTSSAIGLSGSLGPDYALAKVSAQRILKILERKPNPDGYSDEGVKLDEIKGELSFKNLFFRYPNRPEVKVLQEINFTVKAGQTLALVGVSGSGKSTLFSVIERFYNPTSGTVELDGHCYQNLNIRWLRSQIGVVSQEPVLFDMSVADNICYGINDRSISDEEIEAAAKAANIHDFITTLPHGYTTNVGARGAQLSGGQKQRIAIARALLYNPTILLLDEATSALDEANESIVQSALDKAQKGRTSVVITHRMSAIENADVIVVINGGKVKEIGTHKELMAKVGDYYRMVQMQNV